LRADTRLGAVGERRELTTTVGAKAHGPRQLGQVCGCGREGGREGRKSNLNRRCLKGEKERHV
jgi:hypothetical protein